eukprot:g2324.t1
MLKTLTETILRLIPDLTPQDLSTIIWGYATRGVDDNPELIEAVADEAVGKIAHFAPQDPEICWGLDLFRYGECGLGLGKAWALA